MVQKNIFFTWPPTHKAMSLRLFVRPPILIYMVISTCYRIETVFVLTLLNGCDGRQLNHTRLTRFYIRLFQYDSCYSALMTNFDFVLLYQCFNVKKHLYVWQYLSRLYHVSCKRRFGFLNCIPRFRYSAIYPMGSFIGASKTETLLGKYPT